MPALLSLVLLFLLLDFAGASTCDTIVCKQQATYNSGDKASINITTNSAAAPSAPSQIIVRNPSMAALNLHGYSNGDVVAKIDAPSASSMHVQVSVITTTAGSSAVNLVLSNPTAPPDDCDSLTGSASCPAGSSSFNVGYSSCSSGYLLSGTQCNDINECATNNGGCTNSLICVNSIGSYTCTCLVGYLRIAGFCFDVNECATNNGGCANTNPTCTNTAGSFACQ